MVCWCVLGSASLLGSVDTDIYRDEAHDTIESALLSGRKSGTLLPSCAQAYIIARISSWRWVTSIFSSAIDPEISRGHKLYSDSVLVYETYAEH